MGAKTLRASILQMAIEGKLVPQLDEEPAVEQIGDAPEKVPFEIPGKWKWCSLSNIVPNIVDCPHSTPKYCVEETSFRAIDTNCINQYGQIVQWRYVTGETYRLRTSRLKPQKDDIIYTREGSIGRAARLPDDAAVCMGQRVMLIRPGSLMDPRYLQFFLMCPETLAHLTENQRGIGAKHINVSDVKKLRVPVPSVSEQCRIVNRLNELLPLVDKFGKAQEALAVAQKEFPEKLKASLLQEAIQGKLVPQLDEEPSVEQIGDAPEDVPFAIPGKWKWCRLKHLGTLVTGNTPSTSNRCYYGHDIPFIKPDDIGYDSCVRYKKEGLSNAGRAVAKIVPPKSLLMVCIGGSIGKVAIINDEVAFNQQINAIYCNSSVVIVEYLLSVMSSSYFQNTVIATATGTATPIINKSKWGNIFIPIPPLTLQRRIVARLNELLPLVTQIAATTAK